MIGLAQYCGKCREVTAHKVDAKYVTCRICNKKKRYGTNSTGKQT